MLATATNATTKIDAKVVTADAGTGRAGVDGSVIAGCAAVVGAVVTSGVEVVGVRVWSPFTK